MLFPVGLHMERGTTIFTSFFYWPVFLSFLGLLGVSALLIYFYKRQRSLHPERVTEFRVWFFAVGWFFVNLGPTSGITPINAQLYEHWLYLAMVGPLTLALFYLFIFWQKQHHRARQAMVLAGLVATVGVFSFLTIKRNIAWGNAIPFFEDILKYEPHSARINNNLGNLYFDKGDEKKAEEYYWNAVSVEDNFPQPHFNLGSILESRNDIRGAIVEFEKAIAIDPNFPYAYQNLAVIYAAQGDFVKASGMLKKIILLRPQEPMAYYNLAKVEFVRKDPQAAINALLAGLKVADREPETKKRMEELLRNFIQ
jgi:tetratricopeptide (TPR) repeat protein